MIGFLVNKFEHCQLTYCLTKNINELSDKKIMVFYNTISSKYHPTNFATMELVDSHGFDGTLIATDVVTARDLLNINCKKKMFYVYNLEWVFLMNKKYEFMKQIYDNPSMDLIARSESYYNIISNIWKRPKFIIRDFNHKDIVENLL